MDVAHFSYKLQKSYTKGYSPFELVNGQMLISPHTVLKGGFFRSPHVKRFLTAWEEALELEHVHLHDVVGRMKKWVDKYRRESSHIDVGDMVFLRIARDQF